ncbi:hypothetical protein KEM56_006351 [Ascosphaera pollenicola]|nr:hypothetical protein KEM56_006351 [Ascosphaera pollenicola]
MSAFFAEQQQQQQEEWAGEYDPLADEAERKVLFSVLDSFKKYRKTAHHNVTHSRRQAFYALPSSHWQMLAEPPFSILENLSKVDDAIDANADISELILANGLSSFCLPASPPGGSPLDWRDTATTSDMSKAHSTLRQFFRDWSEEGRRERQVCYGPVLNDLKETFGEKPPKGVRVLVPGAGLGRLVFELCLAGYETEGNEVSYHQLVASSWILNHTTRAKEHPLYPFASQFSNLRSREQQLRKIMIPDVHPASELSKRCPSDGDAQSEPHLGSMSMSAADFLLLYGGDDSKDSFDVVATVFFIDTAPNIVRYISTIFNCLRPGGLWINVGPLLWHTSDSISTAPEEKSPSESCSDHVAKGDKGIGEPGRVELTEEEVFLLITKMGFTIKLKDDSIHQCGYIQDPESMLQNLYQPSHWIAVKTIS